jgi:hypothetical protein
MRAPPGGFTSSSGRVHRGEYHRRMKRGIVNVAEINPNAPRPGPFTDAALCLRDSIRAAGYGSTVHVNHADTAQRCVALGALRPHRSALDQLDRRQVIVFNSEPLARGSAAADDEYVSWLRARVVADAHTSNVEWLRSTNGASQRVFELPLIPQSAIAWRPELPYEPGVDVLALGASPRADAVLDALREAGAGVEAASGLHGRALAPALKRSRLVLCVGESDEPMLFPIERLLQAVAQGIPVVCESCVFSALADWSRSGMVFAPYERLMRACMDLLASDGERADRARAAQQFAAGVHFATPFGKLLASLDEVAPAPTRAPIPMSPPRLLAEPTAAPGTILASEPAAIVADGRSRIVVEGGEAPSSTPASSGRR